MQKGLREECDKLKKNFSEELHSVLIQLPVIQSFLLESFTLIVQYPQRKERETVFLLLSGLILSVPDY